MNIKDFATGDEVILKDSLYHAPDFVPGSSAVVTRTTNKLVYVRLTNPLRTGKNKEVGAGGGDCSEWPFIETELASVLS